MPKHWRKCCYCPVNTYNRPDLVVFSLRTSKSSVKSICELHFSDEDMRSHGTTKRLVAGAVPLIPNTQDELLDERSEVAIMSFISYDYTL